MVVKNGTERISVKQMLTEVQAALAVSDLAGRLADALGGEQQFYARQIRRWAQLGFIEATDTKGSGRRAARLFDSEALFPARLLSWCTALGLANPDMEMAVQALYAADAAGLSPLERYFRGERIYLVMEIDHEGQVADVTAKTSEGMASDGDNIPAKIAVNLNALFAPLVSPEGG